MTTIKEVCKIAARTMAKEEFDKRMKWLDLATHPDSDSMDVKRARLELDEISTQLENTLSGIDLAAADIKDRSGYQALVDKGQRRALVVAAKTLDEIVRYFKAQGYDGQVVVGVASNLLKIISEVLDKSLDHTSVQIEQADESEDKKTSKSRPILSTGDVVNFEWMEIISAPKKITHINPDGDGRVHIIAEAYNGD